MAGPEKTEGNIHSGHRDRLFETLVRDPDLKICNDIVILEMLLALTIPRKDTNVLAHQLLRKYGTLYGVSCVPFEQLSKEPNLTKNAVRLLKMIQPTARRIEQSRISGKIYLKTARDGIEYFKPFYMGRNTELVMLGSLDIHNRLIQADVIDEGGASEAEIEPAKVTNIVTSLKAKKVILCHNHPSGSLISSAEDKLATFNLLVVLLHLRVILLDHLIFTPTGYHSFKQSGELDGLYAAFDEKFGTDYARQIRECDMEAGDDMTYLFERAVREKF